MKKYLTFGVITILATIFIACTSDNSVDIDKEEIIDKIEEINFNIPPELNYYYEDVIFATDVDRLFKELREVSSENHAILLYGERHNYLYEIDKDISNTTNVVLMYTGESRYWQEYTSDNNSYLPQTFNTEHVYPQSLYSNEIAQGDLHHLRVCDAEVNELRSNFSFTNGSGVATLINDSSWYPGDEWKGDVARMIMYLNVRYGESFTKVGTRDLFIQWNIEDPVSDFELRRNELIEDAQGNRNPFIDNPYLATIIWGGTQAENRWE